MIENNTDLGRLRHDTVDPVVQAMLIDPLNALSNGFNFVAKKSGSSLCTGKIETPSEPQYETPIDSAVAAVAGGLAAAVPYTIAGQAIGGVARIATTRFNKFVKLPVALTGMLMGQRTANILGGAVYDGLKDTRKGETHLGNAVGGAASFAVFEHGNSRSAGLKGIGWLSHQMKVGAAGSLAHATTSDLASGKNPLARTDYLDVSLSGAAMNSVLPLVQKGGGHLIDKVNLHLGRGIPIERDFARQGNPQLSGLGKQTPLARVHIVENESPRANHKEQAIFVSSHNSVRERAHETQHLISGREKPFEPLFCKSADALKTGDQWLAWQLFRQARLHEELGARKAEALAEGESRSSFSFAKLRDYLPIWKEEFAKFKESGGSFRPELDYSLKHKVSFKSRTLATVESDLDACGVMLDSKLVNKWTPKPRELTLDEARKLLGMMEAAVERRGQIDAERYRNYYNHHNERSSRETIDWSEYDRHDPYDPKFTRAYNQMLKGKSDGARWIAKELKFKVLVGGPGELTQRHLDELGRQWNLYREIKPLFKDPDLASYHLSPYHFIKRKGINTPDDVIAFLDLWTEVAKPGAHFRYRGNPSINSVALVAKYCSELPLHAKRDLVGLEYGQFYRLDFDRLGNVYRLIDCARAWKVEPELPKGIAEQVGRMPANQRFAAKVAWKEMVMTTHSESTRAERMAIFWQAFKKWSSKEPVQFYRSLGEDLVLAYHVNLTQVLDRAIATFHGRALDWDNRKELRKTLSRYCELESSLPISAVVGLKSTQFRDALAHLKKFGERDWDEGEWCPDSALRLTSVFGHRWQQWLDINQERGIDAHDATHWLPMTAAKKAAGLDNWLLKFYDRPNEELSRVAKSWEGLSEAERKLSYKPLVALCASRKYGGQVHEGFAIESARWGVAEGKYSRQEQRWLASLSTEVRFPLEKRWTSGNLTGRFLPRDDARGLYAGSHTYCCQHPDGVGEACAWHGQESPNGGIFVIEDAHKNIVAQSWTWISDDGGVCFDSIEGANLYQRDRRILTDIYQQAANHLAQSHHAVTVGRNSKLDTSRWTPCERLEQPSDFSGYANDSTSQAQLASNPAIPKKKLERENWVRGARSTDLDRARDIARKVYPEGWQFITPGDSGLVLDTKTDGVVGYVTMDTNERYISDIAVLPKFTQYSMKLFNSLGKYLQRIGGEWTADCRESTSYKYMKLQEKRGRVKILSEEKSDSMNGEPMYRVRFTVPTTVCHSALAEESGVR